MKKLIIDIKNQFKKSKIFNFNVVNRDNWIKKEAAKIPNGQKILDVGAGSSPYRFFFKHCEYITQDFCQLNPKQLRFGIGYTAIDIISEAHKIPLPDNSIDVIILTEVLEHVPFPIEVIKEASRLLRKNGKILITAPLGSGLHQQPFHFYGGYTPFWYDKFLSEFHFSKIEIEPNGNFFKYFGQEFQRFIQSTNPLRFPYFFFLKIIWLPIWIFLLPFWIIVPFFCHLIDKNDFDKIFTVGYHVVAIKNE